MKQLANALGLQYTGELIQGVSRILVVADSPLQSQAELLHGLKARTAAQWGDISIVSHQWLEDSALQGVLCNTEGYLLLQVIMQVRSCNGMKDTRLLLIMAIPCIAGAGESLEIYRGNILS